MRSSPVGTAKRALRMRPSSGVPTALTFRTPTYAALKRWAEFYRASGAGFSPIVPRCRKTFSFALAAPVSPTSRLAIEP